MSLFHNGSKIQHLHAKYKMNLINLFEFLGKLAILCSGEELTALHYLHTKRTKDKSQTPAGFQVLSGSAH